MAVTRPFATSPALTAVAVGYQNQQIQLIADGVLPRMPVGAEKFKWTEFPIGEMYTFPPTRVGRSGIVNRVGFSGIERTDSINDYGLEDAIPISDIDEARAMRELGLGNYDPEIRAATGLTNLIMLDREIRVAAIVQNPANYPASCRLILSGTSQLSDYLNSDPIGIFRTAMSSTTLMRPNTISMSRGTWTVLSSHPHLVNAIIGNVTGRGIISPQQFVDLFSGDGLKKLYIGEAFVNTARRGQAETFSRVWGSSIQFSYLNPDAMPEQGGVTWGFTATYGTRIGGAWEDRNVGLQGGRIIRIGERVKEVVCAPQVGFIIQNAVAA